MTDKLAGWLCLCLILAILGDVSYRVLTSNPSADDKIVRRLKTLDSTIAAFTEASFGKLYINDPGAGATLTSDTEKMEYIKYRGDTMLAFTMAYRRLIVDPPTNGVERIQLQDPAILMKEISGIRDEIKKLREDSKSEPRNVNNIASNLWVTMSMTNMVMCATNGATSRLWVAGGGAGQ